MKILGLVGSPRKGGNTHLVVEEALAGAHEQGAETKAILVSDLNFHFCRGCLGCRESGSCVQGDDLEELLEEIEDADGLVLGTPVYGNYLPGQFKALFDRINSISMAIRPKPHGITEVISRLPKKKRNGLILAVCGSPVVEMAEPSLNFLEGFLAVHGNGGLRERIVVPGMGALGQIKMSVEELQEVTKKFELPEELAEQMAEHNRTLLKQIRETGKRLTVLD